MEWLKVIRVRLSHGFARIILDMKILAVSGGPPAFYKRRDFTSATMEENIFIPFEGTQRIRFGASRIDIRRMLGPRFTELKRNEYADNTSDFYQEAGFFVEYDKNNRCNAVEFTSDSVLIIDSADIIGADFLKIKSKFMEHSSDLEEEGEDHVYFYDLGFAISKNLEKELVESVLIFSGAY